VEKTRQTFSVATVAEKPDVMLAVAPRVKVELHLQIIIHALAWLATRELSSR